MKLLNNKIRLIIFLLLGILSANNDVVINQKSGTEIIFIYNSNNGFFNSLTDYIHRQISPSTYSCNLCLITYSNWDRNQRWSRYIDSLPVRVKFIYKNSVKKYEKLGVDLKLPMALLINEENTSVFITEKEINNCNDDFALIDLFNTKLKNAGIIR